jgi:hypothetical protein
MTRRRERSWADRAAFLILCVGLGLVWWVLRPHDKSVEILFLLACAIFAASFFSGEVRARGRTRPRR